MTDQVTNILAALDFNEELELQVNERIRKVAEEVAHITAERVADTMVRTYLSLHGEHIVTRQVQNVVDTKLLGFKNSADYINHHRDLIKQLATEATKEHHRNILRSLTGSYNI